MFFNRHLQRLIVWLACVATLLASLAPSVSYALTASHHGAGGYVEICTALHGVQWVRIDSRDHGEGSVKQSPIKQSAHSQHCAFCLAHGGSLGPPPGIVLKLPLSTRQGLKPALFYHSPIPLFIWSSAQSRAPPSL